MSQPSINVVWECDNPSPEAQSVVNTALSLSEDGLSYLGVSIGNSKVANICPATNTLIVGSARDERDFRLFVENQESPNFQLLAVAGIHEILHTVRYEHFPKKWGSFIKDTVVNEGIAHTGEYQVAQQILTAKEFERGYPQTYFRPQPLLVNSFMQWLDKDAEQESELVANYRDNTHAKATMETLCSDWMDSEWGPANVDILGIQLVGALLSNGASMAEVIEMPSDEIIDEGVRIHETAA